MPRRKSYEYIPSSTVYGTMLAIFTLIMCFAFAWQALNAINLYADIRNAGEIVQGKWVTTYIDPFDDSLIASYTFIVDGKAYRERQTNPSAPHQYTKNGDPVDIAYSIANPNLSRVAGTEGYSLQSLLELAVSLIIAMLTVQFLFAYHLKRPAWIFILQSLVTNRGKE